MSADNPYAEAAKVDCPSCIAKRGEPCREAYCKNGYRDCTYAICHRIRDKETPHLSRVTAAVIA